MEKHMLIALINNAIKECWGILDKTNHEGEMDFYKGKIEAYNNILEWLEK